LSDDLERLLKSVPDRVPPPSRELTGRARESVAEAFRQLRPQTSRGAVLLIAAIVLVGGTAFGAGRWTSASSAASDLSIGARPDMLIAGHSTMVTLFGSVPSGRAGEAVVIEANDCGRIGTFHNLEGVRTEGGGVWSLQVPRYTPGELNRNNHDFVETKTAFRVRWNNRTSESVVVQVRPQVSIGQLPSTRKVAGKRLFGIFVIAAQIKYRPKVVVERRAGDVWKPVAKVVVPITTNSGSRNHAVKTWLRASKGDVFRIRLTAAEAAPCYPPVIGDPSRPVQ
jgi:hypothetical protein